MISAFLETHPELILETQEQIWPDKKFAGDGFYAAVLVERGCCE